MGVDFTCAPSKTKPITIARGQRLGSVVRLLGVDAVGSLDAFLLALGPDQAMASAGWVGAFDFPFGLPRVFVQALMQSASAPAGWPPHPSTVTGDALRADALITLLHQHCQNRQGFAALIDAWGHTWGQGTRPPKLPHRAADTAMPGVSSTSPLQTRYVPVGKMYFEGLWRLVQAGVSLPGLLTPTGLEAPADPAPRLALEAYPGLLAHEIIGRQSYKADARDQQTADRLVQRLSLIDALEQGRTRLGLRLKLTPAQRDHLASDAQGDRLDAVLCLMQAAWGQQRLADGDARCGLPDHIDPIEGWILTA